jgi:hypothetical protein
MTTPPTQSEDSRPRRPAHFPSGLGFLYALAVLLVIWLLIGLFVQPAGWPGW